MCIMHIYFTSANVESKLYAGKEETGKPRGREEEAENRFNIFILYVINSGFLWLLSASEFAKISNVV